MRARRADVDQGEVLDRASAVVFVAQFGVVGLAIAEFALAIVQAPLLWRVLGAIPALALLALAPRSGLYLDSERSVVVLRLAGCFRRVVRLEDITSVDTPRLFGRPGRLVAVRVRSRRTRRVLFHNMLGGWSVEDQRPIEIAGRLRRAVDSVTPTIQCPDP